MNWIICELNSQDSLRLRYEFVYALNFGDYSYHVTENVGSNHCDIIDFNMEIYKQKGEKMINFTVFLLSTPSYLIQWPVLSIFCCSAIGRNLRISSLHPSLSFHLLLLRVNWVKNCWSNWASLALFPRTNWFPFRYTSNINRGNEKIYWACFA